MKDKHCPNCNSLMNPSLKNIQIGDIMKFIKEEMTTGKISPPDKDKISSYICFKCRYTEKAE